MIGGDHIYGAVFYARDQSLSVIRAPERRVHLEPAVLLKAAVIQHQVMGTCFACHVHTLCLCISYKLNTFFCRNMADMVCAACFLSQHEISCYGAPFAFGTDTPVPVSCCILSVVDIAAVKERIVLAVGGDDLSETFCAEHCFTHYLIRLNAPAVIRKRHNIPGHIFKVCYFRTHFTHGDCAVGNNLDRCVASYDLKLLFQMLYVVRHRLKIWHRADSRVASGRCRGTSGFYCFFISKTRFSEMHVNITETGQFNTSVR